MNRVLRERMQAVAAVLVLVVAWGAADRIDAPQPRPAATPVSEFDAAFIAANAERVHEERLAMLTSL